MVTRVRIRWMILCVVGIAGTTLAPGAQAGREQDSVIVDLVCRQRIHGIPFEDAHALGPGAIRRLGEILKNEHYKGCWANAAAVIGTIATPSSFSILREFVWERFRGDVDSETFTALEGATAALGMSLSTDSTAVLDYLVRGADPEFWAKRPWSYPKMDPTAINFLFSRFCIHGLGYTGSPQARSVLLRLQQRPYTDAQRADIQAALQEHRDIAAKGIAEYMASKRKAYDGTKGN